MAQMALGPDTLAPMVEVLQGSGEHEAVLEALSSLADWTKARNASDERRAVAAAGAIPAMVSLLSRADAKAELSHAALCILLHLSRSRDLRDTIRAEGGIEAICMHIGISDISTWEDEYTALVDIAICTVVNLCNTHPVNRDAIRESGGLARVCFLLVTNTRSLGIFKGEQSPRNTQQRALILERAVFALCTLIHDKIASKDAVREAGGITPLVQLISHERANFRSAIVCTAAQCLRMLAFRHASNREALRIAGAINPLRKLLSAGPDNPVTLHAVATFAAMATGNQSNKDEICRAGCIPTLVALVQVGAHRPVARIATSTIMALCYQHAANRRAIRDAGGIPPLISLLGVTPPHPIVEKAAWALSNLAAGCSENQEEFCAQGGLPMVAHLLHLPSSTQGVTVDSTLLGAICKAVAAIVCNLSDQPAKYMAVGNGLVPPLVDIANGTTVAAGKARMALRCLANKCPLIAENIINCGGGVHLRPTSASSNSIAAGSNRKTNLPMHFEPPSGAPICKEYYPRSRGGSRLDLLKETCKKSLENLSLSMPNVSGRLRPTSASTPTPPDLHTIGSLDLKGDFAPSRTNSASNTLVTSASYVSEGQAAGGGNLESSQHNLASIKKSFRVINPLRRAALPTDEDAVSSGRTVNQTTSSGLPSPLLRTSAQHPWKMGSRGLALPETSSPSSDSVSASKYVESPPSAGKSYGGQVDEELRSFPPLPSSPSTPNPDISNQTSSTLNVHRYHTDSSSEEGSSTSAKSPPPRREIHQERQQVEKSVPSPSSSKESGSKPPSPTNNSLLSNVDSEAAGAGDYFASISGDGAGFTYLDQMYEDEAAQFEEAVRRSLAEQQLNIGGGTVDLLSSINELNPAALIFATGAWGRMQDVDSTLF